MADPSTPSLLTIPAELQLEICEHVLESHTAGAMAKKKAKKKASSGWEHALLNFPDLGNLAQTCKQLERVVAPLVYQRVKISVNDPVAFVQLIGHFSLFGHYALLVKELCIEGHADCCDYESMVRKNPGLALTASQVNFVLREGQRLGLDLPPGGIDLSSQLESVLIDTLLCHVPAIKKLVLAFPRGLGVYGGMAKLFASPNDIIFNGVPDDVLSYAGRLPDSFSFHSLRHLEVHPLPAVTDPKTPMSLLPNTLHKGSVTELLRHTPALTRLVIGCYAPVSAPLVQSHLKELKDIHIAEVVDPDLVLLPVFCPQLQRCRFGEDDAPVTSRPEKSMDLMMRSLQLTPGPHNPPGFGVSIQTVLSRLLHLRLALQDLDMDWDNLLIPDISYFRRLSHFSALRSLRVVVWRWPAGDVGVLVDSLPPNLESLCLGGKGMPLYTLAGLLSKHVQSGKLPNFKRFTYTPIGEKLKASMTKSVVAMLGSAGVDYAERKNPPERVSVSVSVLSA